MTEQYASAILAAIKIDDVQAFTTIADTSRECLALCYGRFPVLSLCYLYHSQKIIKAFSIPLKKITKYLPWEEDAATYRKFKEISKKALRLYIYANNVVSPLEMLAILDEKLLLEAEFPTTRSSFDKNKNITTVYSILHHREACIDGDKIKIKKRKLPNALQLLVVILIVCLASATIAFSGVAVTAVYDSFGKGTIESPTKIINENQLSLSLKEGNLNYVLENDITFSDIPEPFVLSGVLDGKGHTVYFKGNSSAEAFRTLSGTLKNINFVFENLDIRFDQNVFLLTPKNDGTLENIKIKVNGTFTKSSAAASSTYFVSCGVGENLGTINGLTLDADVTCNSIGNGDTYLTGIASLNYSTISNCVTTANSRFVTNTVDVSALVTENAQNGVIRDCINNALVTQETNKADWSPNVGGIVLNNFGTIENTSNYGKLEIYFQAQSISNSFIGGIAVNNNSKVRACKNFGEITLSLVTETVNESFIGGIVASNSVVVTSCKNIGKIIADVKGSTLKTAASAICVGGIIGINKLASATITNCDSEGALSLSATGNTTLFGAGIVAINAGIAKDCRNTAEIKASFDDTVEGSLCLGGICAQNQNSLEKNKNSGNITATTKTESDTGFALMVGGIVGQNVVNGTTLALSTIKNCINIATIKLTSTASTGGLIPYVFGGGIAGANYGNIFECISDTTFTLDCAPTPGTPRLFVGGIASFMHKDRLTTDYINNNYFTGDRDGIAAHFTYQQDTEKITIVFGDASNVGCTKKEKSELKDLSEYWE